MSSPTRPLGPLLKQWRSAAGNMTQAALAERIGVHRRTIQSAELGGTNLTEENALAVAEALQLNDQDRATLMSYARRSPANTVQTQVDELRAEVRRLTLLVEELVRRQGPQVEGLRTGDTDPQA